MRCLTGNCHLALHSTCCHSAEAADLVVHHLPAAWRRAACWGSWARQLSSPLRLLSHHQMQQILVESPAPCPRCAACTCCHEPSAAILKDLIGVKSLLQVGYLLGLGDRHPSNLMLDRYSGKLLHIDFGDCFEARWACRTAPLFSCCTAERHWQSTARSAARPHLIEQILPWSGLSAARPEKPLSPSCTACRGVHLTLARS